MSEEAVAKQPETGESCRAALTVGLALTSLCHRGVSPLSWWDLACAVVGSSLPVPWWGLAYLMHATYYASGIASDLEEGTYARPTWPLLSLQSFKSPAFR